MYRFPNRRRRNPCRRSVDLGFIVRRPPNTSLLIDILYDPVQLGDFSRHSWPDTEKLLELRRKMMTTRNRLFLVLQLAVASFISVTASFNRGQQRAADFSTP